MARVTGSFGLRYDPSNLPSVAWAADAQANGIFTAYTTSLSGQDVAVARSTDGLNWVAMCNALPGAMTTAFAMTGTPTASAIYVAGNNHTVVKSTNQGASWTAITLPAAVLAYTNGNIRGIWVKPDGSKLYIVCENNGSSQGTIWSTTDDGGNWTLEHTQTTPSSQTLFGIHGVSNGTAWATGGTTTTPVLLKTDGAGTWTQETVPAISRGLRAIFAVSATEAFAHSGAAQTTANLIIATTDGTTWTDVTPAGTTWSALEGLWATTGHAYFTGKNSTAIKPEIYHSTDSGANWTAELSLWNDLYTQNTTQLGLMSFPCIAGYTGGDVEVFAWCKWWTNGPTHLVMRSTQGAVGGAWKQWGGRVALNAVWAHDASNVYVAGDAGLFFKWDGTTWLPRPLTLDSKFRRISALYGVAADTVYVADFYRTSLSSTSTHPSRILKSTDGGQTWGSQHTDDWTVNALWASGSSDVWAALGVSGNTASVGSLVRSTDGSTWATFTVPAPGVGRAATWVGGSGASDVWVTGGPAANRSGVWTGSGAGGLTFRDYLQGNAASGGGNTYVGAGLALAADDVLLGVVNQHGIVRASVARPDLWAPERIEEVFPTVTAIASMARIGSDRYAVSGLKAAQLEPLLYTALWHNGASGDWLPVTPPDLLARTLTGLWAIGSDVYMTGGTWTLSSDSSAGRGSFVYKFTGPPSAAPTYTRLAPGAVTERTTEAAGTPAAGGRMEPGAVLLTTGANAGKVLVFGGYNNSGTALSTTEFYDPATNAWSAGPAMLHAHKLPAWAVLGNGKVLVVGGASADGTKVQVYDPATNAWSYVAACRLNHSHSVEYPGAMAVLPNGKVLHSVLTRRNVELYDPDTDTWTWGPPCPFRCPKKAITMTAGTHNGRVALFGATNTQEHVVFWAVYNHTLDTWVLPAQPLEASDADDSFLNYVPMVLPDGKVVLASAWDGGSGTPPCRSQVYDPTTDAWSYLDRAPIGFCSGTAVRLADDSYFVGWGDFDNSVPKAFVPANATWRAIKKQSVFDAGHREWSTGPQGGVSVAISDDRVLVAGARDQWFGEAIAPYRVIPATPDLATTWVGRGAMSVTRSFAGAADAATVLEDGKVLVAGGRSVHRNIAGIDFSESTNTSEVFDPATGFWTMAFMNAFRIEHTQTLLANGKVLAAGGVSGARAEVSGSLNAVAATAELYDPVLNTWTATGSMAAARRGARAVKLTTGPHAGKVLVTGGKDTGTTWTATCELYDPAAGTWAATGSMAVARSHHALVVAADGSVVAIGGNNTGGPLTSIEVYNATTGTWSTAAGALGKSRNHPVATLLNNGTIFVYGGDIASDSIEILTGPAWAPTAVASALDRMRHHTQTLLADGRLLLIGGGNDAPPVDPDPSLDTDLWVLNETWYYNPATQALTAGPDLIVQRMGHAAARTGTSLLVIGGAVQDPEELSATATLEVLGAEADVDGCGLPFKLDSLEVVAADTLRVRFTGPVAPADALNASNFAVTANVEMPTLLASSRATDDTEVVDLEFASALLPGTYTVTVDAGVQTPGGKELQGSRVAVVVYTIIIQEPISLGAVNPE